MPRFIAFLPIMTRYLHYPPPSGCHSTFLVQTQGSYSSYYKNSLLYLACVDLKDIPREQQVSRARDIAVAALLGESTYTFGELVRAISAATGTCGVPSPFFHFFIRCTHLAYALYSLPMTFSKVLRSPRRTRGLSTS